MNDRDIALDALDMLKHGTMDSVRACLEASHQPLRQTLVRDVTESEQAQYQLYRMAEERGWYLPPSAADRSEVQRVREFYAAGEPAAR